LSAQVAVTSSAKPKISLSRTGTHLLSANSELGGDCGQLSLEDEGVFCMTITQVLRRILPPIVIDGIQYLRRLIKQETPEWGHVAQGLTRQGSDMNLKAEHYWQDCQIVKERCEDSPGILLLCHGDTKPTPERLAALEKYNYFVISASGGSGDRVDWLPHLRCIGALLHTKNRVSWARKNYPEKIIERSDLITLRTLSTMTQEPANILRSAYYSHTLPSFPSLKTIDIASCWLSVPSKRTELVVESALLGNLSAYIMSHNFGADNDAISRVNRVIADYNAKVETVYLPFEPYAMHKIGEKILIDSRPIGINNGVWPSILDKAHVYLHTSEFEGIPNSIVEALMRNVPVVVCADVKGPLIELAEDIRPAITVSEPTPRAIVETIRKIVANYRDYANVREKFQSQLDPFEINRRIVKRCQELFRSKGIPWKGHCQGLMGGMSARFNIAEDIRGIEQSVGQQPIFPNPRLDSRYLDHQMDLARKANNSSALKVLENERGLTITKINNSRSATGQEMN